MTRKISRGKKNPTEKLNSWVLLFARNFSLLVYQTKKLTPQLHQSNTPQLHNSTTPKLRQSTNPQPHNPTR